MTESKGLMTGIRPCTVMGAGPFKAKLLYLTLGLGLLGAISGKKIRHILGRVDGGASDKESTCQGMRCKRHGFDPWVGKIHLENSMDRGAWWATMQSVANSQT